MKKLLKVFIALLLLVATVYAQTSAGVSVKLEGYVVCCADCWAKADRTKVPYGTPADLEAARECVAEGDPTLLAVLSDEGATTFYELEEGRVKKPGKNWLPLIGSRVEVTGAVRSKKDKNFIKLDSLSVLPYPALSSYVQSQDATGKEAELVLKDLIGVEQRLSAYRGRIVVLNFWATYCVPCRKEMPDLAAIQNSYAPLGVQVIGATAEALTEKPKILQFVRETGVNFPVWVGATVEDMARFGLGPALPGTAIIGRDGKVVYATRSPVTESELKGKLDALIAAAERESSAEIAAAPKIEKVDASTVPS